MDVRLENYDGNWIDDTENLSKTEELYLSYLLGGRKEVTVRGLTISHEEE